MPSRKTYKILAKETDFYDLLVSELRLMNPELVTEYDMESLEITMKKKTKPQILDIDKAIENLQRNLAIVVSVLFCALADQRETINQFKEIDNQIKMKK